ncbi:hypothetical protein ACUOFC_39370, partial [Escherichia sp. TWPC-MK]
ETVSTNEEHTVHSDHSYTNTENIKMDLGYGERGFSFGISADYSHADTNSAGKSDATGSSLQISESASAQINFNIRYLYKSDQNVQCVLHLWTLFLY